MKIIKIGFGKQFLNRVFVLLFLLCTVPVFSQLSTPQVLSSNMVLQQNAKVPVWGKATPNETVKISFAKQQVKAKADANGNWIAELKPMKATSRQQTLTIKGNKTSIEYRNILIGEVWLCSGQSNMQYTMKLHQNFAKPAKGEDLAALELQKPANNMIRLFYCDRNGAPQSWKVADGESLQNTSAPGYFFAKAIQEKTGVPVGIITSAIGGTPIEEWTAKAAYEKDPVFSAIMKKKDGKINGCVPENWYKIMIAPLAPFAFKGVLWYQGETNCSKNDRLYTEKYKILVDSWRETFKNPEAPFYYVIVAPHVYSDRVHKVDQVVTAEELPIFWQQQLKAASETKNTDFIVISDLVDNIRDIHPSYKWEVGARLARLALAKTYGYNDITCSGPRIKTTQITGNAINIYFDHCGTGLKTNDRKRLNWFEVAGQDGIFHPALADIKDKDKVEVYNPDVKNPVYVRFGWHETAMPNLVNSEGLPAAPFTSK